MLALIFNFIGPGDRSVMIKMGCPMIKNKFSVRLLFQGAVATCAQGRPAEIERERETEKATKILQIAF